MATLLDIVKKDSTDVSVTIRVIDSTDGTPETAFDHSTTGIDLWYRREGAAKVSITEAALAALTTAHTDGGVEQIGDGEVRLDLPDAAVATGAKHVDVGGTATGMVVIGGRIRLVDYDPDDSVRMGMTALPNAAADAAGGLPISDAGGLDIDTKLANAVPTAAAIVNEWETQSQADPTGFHVNVKEVNGTAQTAGDIPALVVTADAAIDVAVADLANATDGLTALKAVLDAIPTSNPTAAAIADAVWDETLTAHVTADSAAVAVKDTLADTNELQGDDVPGLIAALDVVVDRVEADTQDLQTQIGTAGAGLTNINLPNQTMDITGNLSGSVGSVTGTVGGVAGTITTLDALDTAQDTQHSTTQTAVNKILPAKNAALSNIEFIMVDATDGFTPETGVTVSGTKSIDGGAYAAVTGTIAEVANGTYQFDASAADMNGTIITFRFTGTGCADRFLTIRTSG